MKSNPDGGLVDRPWKPAFEWKSSLAWFSAGVGLLILPITDSLNGVMVFCSIFAFLFAISELIKVFKAWSTRLDLFQSHVSFMSDDEYFGVISALPEYLFLGNGFEWKSKHRSWAEELAMGDLDDYLPPQLFIDCQSKYLKRNYSAISTTKKSRQKEKRIEEHKAISAKYSNNEAKRISALSKLDAVDNSYRGWSWLNGLEKSTPLLVPLDDTKGNTLIAGTTRSGKSVLFRFLIKQLVSRKECTIIIDPKGDLPMMDIAMESAQEAGVWDNIALLHLGFPSLGVRFDPMSNFDTPAQLASRIEPIIPSSGKGGDSFSQFAWGVMESIFSAMVFVNIKPSIMSLKSVIEKGPGDLLYTAILHHCSVKKIPDYKKMMDDYKKSNKDNKRDTNDYPPQLLAAAEFYKEVVKPEHPHTAIDGLLNFFEHNRDHATKMLASLMPVLKSLTTGELQGILSPNYDDPDDHRPILDFKKVIKQKKVIYIGLNSMGDKNVADAVASLLMSDLTSVAASRYNFIEGVEEVIENPLGVHTINLLIDEMSNVMNASCIELLNKGAGAGFRIFGATQTVPDIAVALGDGDEASKAIGNFNNVISLRVIDDETKEYVAKQSGQAYVRTTQETVGSNTGGEGVAGFGGSYGARSTDTEAELVPEKILKNLPDLEFFAFVSAGTCYKGRVPILQASENAPKVQDLPWNKYKSQEVA